MTGRSDRTRRIQNYLDGYLTPDQEAGVRRRIRESQEWKREFDELRAVYSLLDTPLDIDPPEDLLPGIFTAIRAEAVEKAARRWLPARVENGLVLAGAAALAGLLVVGGRTISAESVLGRVAVGWASTLSVVRNWFVGGVDTALQLDWASRTLGTLAEAGRTALTVSAEPLLLVATVSGALTIGLGWLVLRSGASGTPGGLSHG